MWQLVVSIERNGARTSVGKIEGKSSEDAVFSYFDNYINASDSRAISISLPLTSEPFSPSQTRHFFEGLLPEGFLRSSIASANHADDADYLRLLELLGSECLGAIQICSPDYLDRETGYREMNDESLQELAQEGAEKSAELVVRSRLSLTGASGKIGVYKSESGKWFLPMGLAPSTHILKQSHIRYRQIVQNEQLCQLTASIMGIDTPESSVMIPQTADTTEQMLFVTKRYDRTFEGSNRYISGLLSPLRLHQEDFAQALGISSVDKYESSDGQYMKKMFDLLRERSASPIEDQIKLWDIIVFQYLIGNTDGHIKNYSLLYDAGLQTVRLAPAYDLVSTIIYRNHTSNMSFQIGHAKDWYQLDRTCFEQAAMELGLNQSILMDRYSELSDRFEKSLQTAANQLGDKEHLDFHFIANQILDKHKR